MRSVGRQTERHEGHRLAPKFILFAFFAILVSPSVRSYFHSNITQFFQLPTCLEKYQICTDSNNVVRGDCMLSVYRNFCAFICFSKADICALSRRRCTVKVRRLTL